MATLILVLTFKPLVKMDWLVGSTTFLWYSQCSRSLMITPGSTGQIKKIWLVVSIPLKNIGSSLGMMTFTIYEKSYNSIWFQSPPTRNIPSAALLGNTRDILRGYDSTGEPEESAGHPKIHGEYSRARAFLETPYVFQWLNMAEFYGLWQI